jgi:tRNA-splicing ligase RtcB
MKQQRIHTVFKGHRGVPVKAWIEGVALEEQARQQLLNVAQLPIIHRWIAAMPDVHWGMGATVGCVIPTVAAIIPAAVGVDIGCGMTALKTTLIANDLPDNLSHVRHAIEQAVPHGRTHHGGTKDEGSFRQPTASGKKAWAQLSSDYEKLVHKHPTLDRGRTAEHLGTLGSGNHFIEICLDEHDAVWAMLHSGSRGVGNRIGRYFIALAQRDMSRHLSQLPDKDLAYFKEGARHFDDYVFAVDWAQSFARTNRRLMMDAVLTALASHRALPPFECTTMVVDCHHNYVSREWHYGKDVYLTRKGAVRAGKGELGIIPGSMGVKSFIVRGLGHPESFESCSHGAGRAMSRRQAKRQFSLNDHGRATAGVECRKDSGVLDETPGAYKPIDAVMNAQKDLVEVLHTLKQVVCVKG